MLKKYKVCDLSKDLNVTSKGIISIGRAIPINGYNWFIHIPITITEHILNPTLSNVVNVLPKSCNLRILNMIMPGTNPRYNNVIISLNIGICIFVDIMPTIHIKTCISSITDRNSLNFQSFNVNILLNFIIIHQLFSENFLIFFNYIYLS